MKALTKLHQAVGRFVPGMPIWNLEWDVLCILDGCRVDTYREFRDCDEYRSVAASSRQWIERTFADTPDGVAYVTGNPFLDAVDTDQLDYVHQEPVSDVDGVETVPPTALADHAAALWNRRDEYNVDSLVVHFMQPHVPFRSRPEWFDPFFGTDTWGSSRWNALANGDIGREAWFDAYRKNLAWVLADGVNRVAKTVDATIGVTADHGNAAGEWGIYGHPKGVAVPSVRRVPWETIEGERHFDGVDIDLSGDVLTENDREGQLRALGYL